MARYLEADLQEVFVKPFYMNVMGQRYPFLTGIEEEYFLYRARVALALVDAEILADLSQLGWRETMMASWFAGVLAIWERTGNIGKQLAESRHPYAGRAHIFALARMRTADTVSHLQHYLRIWLAKPECHYDQPEAMAALMLIDGMEGANHAAEFLQPGGLWEAWSRGNGDKELLSPEREKLSKCIDFVEENLFSMASGEFVPGARVQMSSEPQEVFLRREPAGMRSVIMRMQRSAVKFLYRAGITERAAAFRFLLKLSRSGPLGYCTMSHDEWVRRQMQRLAQRGRLDGITVR